MNTITNDKPDEFIIDDQLIECLSKALSGDEQAYLTRSPAHFVALCCDAIRIGKESASEETLRQRFFRLKVSTLSGLLERMEDPECPPAIYSAANKLLKDNEEQFKDQPETIENLLNEMADEIQTTFTN